MSYSIILTQIALVQSRPRNSGLNIIGEGEPSPVLVLEAVAGRGDVLAEWHGAAVLGLEPGEHVDDDDEARGDRDKTHLWSVIPTIFTT